VNHPAGTPALVFADSKGRIHDFQDLAMAGMAHDRVVQPTNADLIELPEGSELFVLPGRLPVGTDPVNGEMKIPLARASQFWR